MVNINFDNVILGFQELSGCDVEKINENMKLIEGSVFGIERLIDENEYNEEFDSALEYAAAASAFYDYICKEGACEHILCTAYGKASSNEDYSKKLDAAKKLKDNSLNALRGIVLGNSFVFMTTEG